MINLTWEDIEAYCDRLAEQVDGKYDAVYGVPRGGLVPAVMLSHRLGIMVASDQVMAVSDIIDANILIVDDINDTGKTVKRYQLIPSDVAVLVERNSSDASANFTGIEVYHNDWLVFPWESKERAEEDEKSYLNSRNIDAR